MASYRSGRRSGGSRSSVARRGSRTGTRSRRAMSASRRRVSTRRSSGGTRTVRLVIEQAAPTVQPVLNEDGKFAVPDNSVPRRAKF